MDEGERKLRSRSSTVDRHRDGRELGKTQRKLSWCMRGGGGGDGKVGRKTSMIDNFWDRTPVMIDLCHRGWA